MTEQAFSQRGSSTTNKMKHVKAKHKKQLQGPVANNTYGPIDSFVRKVSDIEKQIAVNPNVSDDLIREDFENFILSETEAFTLIQSESFLTFLRVCLKCKRDNVYITKAEAFPNGV